MKFLLDKSIQQRRKIVFPSLKSIVRTQKFERTTVQVPSKFVPLRKLHTIEHEQVYLKTLLEIVDDKDANEEILQKTKEALSPSLSFSSHEMIKEGFFQEDLVNQKQISNDSALDDKRRGLFQYDNLISILESSLRIVHEKESTPSSNSYSSKRNKKFSSRTDSKPISESNDGGKLRLNLKNAETKLKPSPSSEKLQVNHEVKRLGSFRSESSGLFSFIGLRYRSFEGLTRKKMEAIPNKTRFTNAIPSHVKCQVIDSTSEVKTPTFEENYCFISSRPEQTIKSSVFRLDRNPLNEKVICAPSENMVPKLAHNLSRVLLNPGIHPLRDLHTNVNQFSSFLEHIHQPEEVDFCRIPSYKPSSKDELLHSLAAQYNCRFKGSTSSVSGLLSHLYLMLSSFKKVNLESLSLDMQFQVPVFSRQNLKSSGIYIRPSTNSQEIYSIDSDQGLRSTPNRILMDLVKRMKVEILAEQI